MLPLFLIMFIANYIDRVNVGFVSSHLQTDLGTGAAAYGLGSGLFFIGYASSKCRRTADCRSTARARG
ncbi:MAG: Uncharacterized MFS-type transporter [uncultured Caballeronia sp.]|nr:MAG: Uncharacterized MFS-type transporter [uncultured Caballeronia sp.]